MSALFFSKTLILALIDKYTGVEQPNLFHENFNFSPDTNKTNEISKIISQGVIEQYQLLKLFQKYIISLRTKIHA